MNHETSCEKLDYDSVRTGVGPESLSNVCPDCTDTANSKPTFESQGPRAKPIAIRGKNCFALIETQ